MLRYDVEDRPPFLVAFPAALQHLLMSFSSVLSIVYLLGDAICADVDDPVRSRLFSTSLFMLGCTTILESLIGVRLPVFQGASATFLVPLLALKNSGHWKCEKTNSTSVTGTNTSRPSTLRYDRITELQGSLMVAVMFEVIVGATGLIGYILRFIGPITISVTLTLMGISLYEVPLMYSRPHWGVALFGGGLMLLFTIYLIDIKIKLPRIHKSRPYCSCNGPKFPLYQVFPVLLTIFITWAICGILTAVGGFSNDPDNIEYRARTDTKISIIDRTAWLLFPYPGQFGSPGFSVAAFVGFLIAVMASTIDSVGDYFALAKAAHAPPPPKHAINRGILLEGFMGIISGAMGTGHATTSFNINIAIVDITQVASRNVLILAGIIAMVLSIFGKFAAIMSALPDPVIGGVLLIGLGIIPALGLSGLKDVDLGSSRNLTVIGVSLFLGVVIPEWVKQYPEDINTGNTEADQVLKIMLGTHMFLGATIATILDNTVKGTKEERGILQRDLLTKYSEIRNDTKIYDIPGVHYVQKNIKLFRYLPFLQNYRIVTEHIDPVTGDIWI